MQNLMRYLESHEHEQLVACYDKHSGLRAFIGIHSTTLGPSLGGIRLWNYDNEDEAILDVLRLSEGMTYKAAIAGLALGGGKTVIMADGQEDDPAIRAARFEALGRFIDGLSGQYIGAEDVGTKPQDMVSISQHTRHVVGLPPDDGGSDDPSPVTAFGVFRGIQAVAEVVLGRTELSGVRVNVQGFGKVGMGLVDYLVHEGAIVTGSDFDEDRLKMARTRGVTVVPPDEIYDVPADIFAPCALGASLNDDTIPRLNVKAVAGAANNQLAEERHAKMLADRGIAYAVDYVINAGGLINVSYEALGQYDRAAAYAKTGDIYYTVKQLLLDADERDITTFEAAKAMAHDILEQRLPVGQPT